MCKLYTIILRKKLFFLKIQLLLHGCIVVLFDTARLLKVLTLQRPPVSKKDTSLISYNQSLR